MSYEPTTWKSGDVVTSAKLNKIEQGIANAGGGGGALVVHVVDETLDKTWQEIHDAAPLVWLFDGFATYNYIYECGVDEGAHFVSFISPLVDENVSISYMATSADGYPVFLST